MLELGFGTGLFTRRFNETGADITAIDTSPNMYQKTKELGLSNVNLMLMDAHELGFKDNSFDIVVGCFLLQWVRWGIVVSETLRVTKPEGKVSFLLDNCINPWAFSRKVGFFFMSMFNSRVYPKVIWPWALKANLQYLGFKDIEISSLEFVHNRDLNSFIECIPVVKEFGGTLFVSATK